MANDFDINEAVATVAASLYGFRSDDDVPAYRDVVLGSCSPEWYRRYTILTRVLTAYAAPERDYHGVAHVVAAIKMFDIGARKSNLPDYQRRLGVLALLFHDVVYTTLYVPETPDEIVSAQVAKAFLFTLITDNDALDDRTNEPGNVADIVSYLIQATGMHLKEKNFENILGTSPRSSSPWGSRFDELTRLVMDADLSILMTSAERALQCWEDGVRREYMLVPDHVYVPERLKVYKAFLDRGYVFRSSAFQECNKGALEIVLTLGKNLLAQYSANPDIYNSIPEDVRNPFLPAQKAVTETVVRPPIGS